ncbi:MULTISPECIES: DMT family transporter [unclassified Francisella]|uniref:DMT family transporter n=1 Tax=unclassified Francisella TaxID=2610885 RepID=UPI002E323F44|nr:MULTISPECIES: DMT family transporter [unclassified Francisella]MED7819331.1 DMT family transporter [Francisella sp. 19S2-4]MED7830129.1 DMT family transporter [Francisella sp. 19S2-10]
MRLMQDSFAMFLMLLSATSIAFVGYATKFMMSSCSIYAVMLVFFVGSAILMWWIVSISSYGRIRPLEWKPIFIRVILSITAQYFLFLGLYSSSLLLPILLFNTSPLFIPIIRWIFHKAKIGVSTWILLVISFFGIYLILGSGSGGHADIWALSALVAGVLNAGSQVVLHTASQKENLFTMNLWIFTFISILMLIGLPFTHITFAGIHYGFTNAPLIWAGIAAVIFGVSAQLFRVKSFKYTADPSFVAPGMYFSVVVAAILDACVYNKGLNLVEVLGILIVCATSIFSVIKKK